MGLKERLAQLKEKAERMWERSQMEKETGYGKAETKEAEQEAYADKRREIDLAKARERGTERAMQGARSHAPITNRVSASLGRLDVGFEKVLSPSRGRKLKGMKQGKRLHPFGMPDVSLRKQESGLNRPFRMPDVRERKKERKVDFSRYL